MTQETYDAMYAAWFKNMMDKYLNQSANSRDIEESPTTHHETYIFGTLVGGIGMAMWFGMELGLNYTRVKTDLDFLLENFPKDTPSLIKALQDYGYVGVSCGNQEPMADEEGTIGASQENAG